MAKEIEGQTLREYGNRKKRYKRRMRLLIGLLLLALLAVGAVFLYRIINRSYKSYEVMHSIVNKGEAAAGYLSLNNMIVKYSKDGAEAIDKDGNVLWNGSYEMTDPIADSSGKYIVIADRGNKTIQIFNEKGPVKSYTSENNIIKAEIASQGVVAVLMEDGTDNYISMFDTDGSELVHMKTSVSKEGYPIDIALSDDGEKLITSYVLVNTGKLESKVGFFNFGEVGQNYIDNTTGGYTYEKQVVARVAFLGNDVACAYKDNGFMIYSMRQIPKQICEINQKKKIASVLYNEKYAGVVLEGDDASSKQLVLYDLKGKQILNRKLNFDYDRIYLSDDEIIMYDNVSCLVMKTSGKIKFRYTFKSNIEAFYPINHIDRYFYANASKISEILLGD